LIDFAAGAPDYKSLVRPYSLTSDSRERIILTDPGMSGVHIFDFAQQKYKFISSTVSERRAGGNIKALEGEGAAGHTDAAGPDAPTDYGGAVGTGVAGESLARGGLARRQQRNVAFAFCRIAGQTRVRPQRGFTARTVVADGVARERRGAKRLLVGTFASETLAETVGRD
jgi:hypothetical protein